MLDSFRKFAKSKVAAVIFGLLILSFGVFWGMSDLISDRGSTNKIASVGKEKIHKAELQQALKAEIDHRAQEISQQAGQPVDLNEFRKQALESGLGEMVLEQLIQKSALRQEAKDFGVVASDTTIREALQKLPFFLDDNGQFSREKFHRVLQANSMTEEMFVNSFRNDLTMSQLLSSLSSIVTAHPSVTEKFYAFDMEQREIKWTVLTQDLITDSMIPSIDEAQVQGYYDANPGMFTAPEYRDLSALIVSLEALKKNHTATEDELQQEFKRLLPSFTTPEKRKILQIVAKDEATAKNILSLLDKKAQASELPKMLGENVVHVTEGDWVEQRHIHQKAAETIFKLKKGEHTHPVKSPNGIYIFIVEDIKDPEQPPFEAVASKVKDAVLRNKAKDDLYQLVKLVEDDVSSGSTFAEVAQKHQLIVIPYLGVDAQGRNIHGEQQEKGGNFMSILKAGFETAESMESHTIELPNEDMVIVRVDKVIPSHVIAFEDAKAIAKEFFVRELKNKALGNLAEKLMSDNPQLSAEEQKAVRQASLAHSFKLGRTGQINLDAKSAPKGTVEHKLANILNSSGGITRAALDKVFDANVGQSVELQIPYFDSEHNMAFQSYLVGKVTKLIEAKKEAFAKNREQYHQMMTQAYTADIMTFYTQALLKKFPSKILQKDMVKSAGMPSSD
jgi:peptidyl-prolyl cis-trans isomerase D